MKRIFIILLLVISCMADNDVFAQTRNFTTKADEAFERKQYKLALERYKKAFKKTKKKKYEEQRTEISYKMAECYRLTEATKSAEVQYRRVSKTDYFTKHPVGLYHYGEVLVRNGKYDEAAEAFNAYLALDSTDNRAKEYLETLKVIDKWLTNPSKYEVTRMKSINSKNSDYGATWTSNNYNEVIFTSTREGVMGKEKDAITGERFCDLFVVRQDKNGKWDKPEPASDDDIVNTIGSDGAAFMNANFTKLYFTRCPNTKRRQSGCQIMVSSRAGGAFGEPVPVEIEGLDSLDIIGHPTLTSNERRIYFATQRHGGFGGKDIWTASRESSSGAFGRPHNIGPVINTAGDEMFPFLRNDTILYFASDGHGGLGGLDIFMSTIDSMGNWSKPVNLKSPINSPGNDFAIMFHKTEERGFFSSNRDSRNGLDDDIFYFEEPPVLFTISGTIFDDNTLQPLNDASINIIGSDDSRIVTRSSEDGKFIINSSQLNVNTIYYISIDKEGYFSANDTVSTMELEFGKTFESKYSLARIPNEPVILPDILYDLGKWDLKPQSQDSLQSLITMLMVNPNITIELGSHTDSRDTDENNDALSQKRAQSVVDYLILRGIDPLRLTAKGYGERVPRTVNRDYYVEGFVIKKGTKLTEDYINRLSKEKVREFAHQLNRRTEFRIISVDFVPREMAEYDENASTTVTMRPEDNKTEIVIGKNGIVSFKAVVDGFTENITFSKNSEFYVSQARAMALLKSGIITKDNFKDQNAIKTGSIADKAVFVIKEMRIADRSIENVEVTVHNRLKYEWLIGEKILKRFGKFEINTKERKLIFNKK